MSLSTTPSLDSSVRPSFASGYASPLTGGMAHPELWDGVVGAWCPSLGATGGTLRDLSGNHNHGTLTNFTLSDAWADPEGLTFDGSDSYVTVPDSDSLHPGSNLTLSAWVYIDAFTETYTVIFDKPHTSHTSPFYNYHMRLRSTDLYFWVDMGGGDTHFLSYSNTWDTGRLYHFAATYGSKTSVLYVDGQAVASKTHAFASDTINDSGEPLRIGAFQNLTIGNVDGVISSGLMHNRTLTANEIATLYRLGPAGIYQRKQPVITTAEEVVGGLSIPIAAYHYNHNVGSRL